MSVSKKCRCQDNLSSKLAESGLHPEGTVRFPDAGEQLMTGWEVILKMLEVVPKWEEATTIALAFQGVQLVATDCMPNLPAQLLRTSLEVSALYASQQVRQSRVLAD